MGRVIRYGNAPPPPEARIDRGHPLAQGLAHAILPARIGQDAASGREVRIGPGSRIGVAIVQNDSSDKSFWTPAAMGDRLSVVWVGRALDSSTETIEYAGFTHSGADVNPYVRLTLSASGSTVRLAVNDNGSLITQNLFPWSTISGRVHTVVVTTGRQVWLNGSLNWSGSAVTPSSASTSRFGVGHPTVPTRNPKQECHAAYGYTRILTPSDVAWITAEPYAMFVLERKVFYSIPQTPQYRPWWGGRSRIVGSGVLAR